MSETCARVGLNSDHLGKEFRLLMKKTAEVLSGHYPETMHKTCMISRHRPRKRRLTSRTCPRPVHRYVINGPLIVRAAWNVTRQHATLDAELRVPPSYSTSRSSRHP